MFREPAAGRAPRYQEGDATTRSVPAPVGGWNARDPLADMQPQDAVILENWFPRPGDVQMRQGSIQWATGMSGMVNTVASWIPNSGSPKMFAAVGSNIYDITAGGAVGAAVVSGLTSDKWQWVNFEVGASSYLYMVNGADKPLLYDGTTWKSIDGASTPAITGVTTTSLIGCWVFKQRIFFIQSNSMSAWYLGVNSIGGAANQLDFGSIFRKGGNLVAMGTWALDAGTGIDDFAVFITSEGEVAVYRGTDPTSANTWALVGVWDIGYPIGRRAVNKYAGDLLIISKDGLLPFAKALMSSRVDTQIALTDKILSAISDATAQYGSNFGWQTVVSPRLNMLILNVPTSSTTSMQFVMNTITGSWCRFTGWNAASWILFQDDLYYGGNGVVYKAWSGNADVGANIQAEALQAFDYFDARGRLKKATLVRPIISADSSYGLLLGVNADFDTTAPTGLASVVATTGATWDGGAWDSGLWGGSSAITRNWQGAAQIGFALGVHLIATSKSANVSWASTDWVCEAGGTL